MKKIVLFLLITSMLLSCACTHRIENDDLNTLQGESIPPREKLEDVSYDLDSYILSRNDEEWFIEFKEDKIKKLPFSDCTAWFVDFPDMDSLLKAIKEDSFTTYDRYLVSFFSSENGKIKIFNIDNIPELCLPDEYTINSIYWEGEMYQYNIVHESGLIVTVISATKEYYDYDYNKTVDDLWRTDKYISKVDENGDMIFQTSSDFTSRIYVVHKEDNFTAVYLYNFEESLPTEKLSETVPKSVCTFKNDNGINQIVFIQFDRRDVKEDEYYLPFFSVEGLKQIGLKYD